MTVRELSKEQLVQLKQDYFVQRHGGNISYEELANIDKFVSDDEVFDYYGDVYFTKEDFF